MKKSDEQTNDSNIEMNEVNITRKRLRQIDLTKDFDYCPSDDDCFEEPILNSSIRRPRTRTRTRTRTQTSPGRSQGGLEETKKKAPNYYEGSDDEHDEPDEPDEPDERFEQSYICFPLSAIDKEHLEDGNRIIMPQSALERLTKLNVDYPMMFEIKKQGSDGPVSHCGVLEFIAEEGFVCLPNWMMKNLDLHEGERVMMKNATLKQGTFMKIQPHQTAFINLPDAKDVLEKGLRGYSCVTTGDTISIPHNQARFLIDIVETKPERAISVVETDCVVDFAPPLDYKEPEKRPREEKVTGKNLEKEQKQQKEKAELQPFSGKGRRLDGVLVGSASSLPVANMPTTAPERQNFPKKFDVRNCDSSKSNSSGKRPRENSETEEKMFKPFTGKKYTLNG